MNLQNHVYLGDSVYVRVVDGMIELTTHNDGGLSTPSNQIFLEPEVLDAFLLWLNRKIQVRTPKSTHP